MEIKSHLFEKMQFCFLHSILLFLYLSVMLRPNFLKKTTTTTKVYLVFSCTVTFVETSPSKNRSAQSSLTEIPRGVAGDV